MNRPGAIRRTDIVWLGISAAVTGSLVSGLMLGIGLGLATRGVYAGFLLVIPAAPAAGGIGWLLSRRLARQLG